MNRARTIAAVVALCCSSPNAASAADCDAAPKVCARRAFDRGVQAGKKESWQEAVDAFEEAYAIRQHPVVAYNLALAKDKLGQHVEALELLDKVIADAQTDDRTRDAAKEERDYVAARTSVVSVVMPSAKKLELSVDDQSASGAAPELRVNPGKYAVKVVADGKTVVDRSVELSPGERLTLTVDRQREVVVETKPAGAAATPRDSGTEAGLDPAWFWAGLGVTGVLAGVSVWSGLDTQSAKSDYDDDLPSLSRAEAQQRLDDGNSKETRTNVLFALSGVAAVGTAALGLFVVDWGSDERKAGAQLLIGPASASLRGSF